MDNNRILEISNNVLIQYGKISLSSAEVTWNQPTLSSNGTMGGSSFAVSDNGSNGTNTYKGFDKNNSTCTYLDYNGYRPITFYIPTAVKLKSLTLTYSSNYLNGATADILASNDNSNWTTIYSGAIQNASGGNVTYTVTINSNGNYKYFKISPTSHGKGQELDVYECVINATYLTSSLNTIYLPTSYTSTNYGAAFTYIGGSSTTAYISNRTASTISLANVDSNVSSGSYITIGY